MRGATKKLGAIFGSMVLAASVVGVAAASDDVEPADAGDGDITLVEPEMENDEATPVIDFTIDEESGAVVFALPDEEGALADCSEAVVELDEEGNPTLAEGAPEGCSVMSILGPNGQANHGSLVSSFARSLDPKSLGDVKKGHVMREIAKSDFGKGSKDEAGDEDGDFGDAETSDAETDEVEGDPEAGGPPAHAKAHGRKKPGKSPKGEN